MSNATEDLFYAKLWEDDAYQKIFFAHRTRLFARIDDDGELWARLPVFFAGSMPPPQAEHVLAVASEMREVSRASTMKELDGKFDEFSADLKTLSCMLVLRFVDRNASLRALLDEGRLTWADVAPAAAGKLELDIFEDFRDEGRGGTGGSDDEVEVNTVDPVLRAKVRKYVDRVRRFARTGDFLKFTDVIDNATTMIPVYALCREQLVTLLAARRLTLDEYGAVLRDLYLKKLIANIGTTFWCPRCEDDACVLSSSARLSPLQLVLPCPKCGQSMLCATLYQVHGAIRDACFEQDGLLGEAVGWLLRKRNLEFQRGVYAKGQFETDYLFTLGTRRILLECKVHKSDKDSEAVQRHLATAIAQAVKHSMAVKQEGGVDEVWVLTNHCLDERADELRRVEKGRRKEIAEHNIRVVDPPSLVRLLGVRK